MCRRSSRLSCGLHLFPQPNNRATIFPYVAISNTVDRMKETSPQRAPWSASSSRTFCSQREYILISLVNYELSELVGPRIKNESSPERLHGIEIDHGESAPISKISSAFFLAPLSPIRLRREKYKFCSLIAKTRKTQNRREDAACPRGPSVWIKKIKKNSTVRLLPGRDAWQPRSNLQYLVGCFEGLCIWYRYPVGAPIKG